MGNNTNDGWEWKLSWRTALFDSEIQMADNFLGELSQQQIQPNREDRCSWKHDQTGYYSTKSGYDLIWEAQMGANQNLDFVDIWKLKIPTLIPKINDPQSFNDYRPISLIGCVYKIVARVLAKRLAAVLPHLIDERQTAFMKGRHILHGVLIANETIAEAKSRSKPCMVFKADFENAYDSVSWGFLDYMLKRMGFCESWRKWINGCLNTATISILINGSPSKEFTPKRGLRQGDPLAPFLFNIVAEGLTGFMRSAVSKNLFRSYLVGSLKEEVNILQYADDTLFFGDATKQNVRTLKCVLRCFEEASGLKINYSKSHFGCLGKSASWCREAAQFLNCSTLEFPFTYLGIPVGVSSKSWIVLQPIVRKFEVKLAKWKQRTLSMGGRITLINSVLSALPIYLLSFFRIPKKVVQKIVSIQRNFLWGSHQEASKIPWVKWDKVCLPKNKGGLGIKDLSLFNAALLGKWGWQLANNQDQPWSRILISKYGGWKELICGGRRNFTSQWWQDLKSIFQQHHNECLTDNLKWRVGRGSSINFWKHKWMEDNCTLQGKYPQLYLISKQQNSSINSMGDFMEGRWEWKLSWRRNFFDHEIQLAADFLVEIDSVHIHQSSRDFLWWKPDTNGVFSTNFAYKVLQEAHHSDSEDNVLNIMWKLKIPPKVSAFSWRLFKNRLPTRDNLRKTQVTLPSYSCPLCDHEEESIYHLMFNCEKTRSLWWETMRWVNRVGSYSIDPKNHFLQFTQWNSKDSTNKRWEFLWLALSFSIWYHRNAKIFKNQPFTPGKIMDDALFHTWSWIKCVEKDFQMHFNFWSTNLKDVLS
ncbi:uncharacterized protein LOC114371443 [Glycine soja]|nr:uncharacterized protein LOC114371443 [Glycine soja]